MRVDVMPNELTSCMKCFERGHDAKHCTVDKRDFDLVGPMAAFIGARLNYRIPECNGPRKYVGRDISTIKVDQHKEKFWYIRIYCTLADPGLVQQRWLEDREREADGEEPPQEFKDKCFRHDAFHYRRCHLDMMALVPERQHKRIRSQADYWELLFSTKEELEKCINEAEAKDLANDRKHDSLEHLRDRYRAETNAELKEKIGVFYGEQPWRERFE